MGSTAVVALAYVRPTTILSINDCICTVGFTFKLAFNDRHKQHDKHSLPVTSLLRDLYFALSCKGKARLSKKNLYSSSERKCKLSLQICRKKNNYPVTLIGCLMHNGKQANNFSHFEEQSREPMRANVSRDFVVWFREVIWL